MPEKAWKRAERKVAEWFGARRNPLSGSTDHTSKSDTIHERLFIEVKFSQKPFSSVNIWDTANEKSQVEGKVPVVALVQKGRPGFWLVVHCDDLANVTLERGKFLEMEKLEVKFERPS